MNLHCGDFLPVYLLFSRLWERWWFGYRLVIYMYVSGETWNATGLLLYSLLITGNIDYVARITIMKKMGNVHPVITVLGVLIGLGLFGFIGLIFGPLLVSYIVVLFRIYMNEFTTIPDEKKPDESAVVTKEPSP